jgi:hypothetical protein
MEIHVGTNYTDKEVKAVLDKDCLPPQIHKVHTFTSTASDTPASVSERFWNFYDALKIVEVAMGYHVTIDFGEWYYDSTMDHPERSVNEQSVYDY